MDKLTLSEINELMGIINNIIEAKKEEKEETDLHLPIPYMEIHYVRTPSTYHQSQKNAIKKYINNNREKYNEYHRTRHNEKMANDPEYKEHFKNRMRGYYLKRKEKKQSATNNAEQKIEIGEPIETELDVEELK